jgi:hypothetical protein
MSPETVATVMDRLQQIERALADARAEIDVLRTAALDAKRSKAVSILLCISFSVGVTLFGRSSTSTAQESGHVGLDSGQVEGSAGSFAASSGHTITAPFYVVTRAGKKLLRVEDSPDHNVLTLYGADEQPAATLFAHALGGGMQAVSKDKVVAAIGVDADGDGGLVLHDRAGHHLADIQQSPNGGARGLDLYDSAGNLRLVAQINPQKADAAEIALRTKPGVNQVELFANASESFVYTANAAQQPIALLGYEMHSEPADGGKSKSVTQRGLTIYGESGSPVIEAKLDADGDGNIKVKAGSDPDLGVFLGFGDKEPVFCLHTKGKCQVALGVSDGKPGINMSSASGASLVNLAEGSFGEGILQLGNSSGTSIVEAGATEDGRGIVRAFPYAAGGGMGLFPGAYIRGRPFNQ